MLLSGTSIVLDGDMDNRRPGYQCNVFLSGSAHERSSLFYVSTVDIEAWVGKQSLDRLDLEGIPVSSL